MTSEGRVSRVSTDDDDVVFTICLVMGSRVVRGGMLLETELLDDDKVLIDELSEEPRELKLLLDSEEVIEPLLVVRDVSLTTVE